MVRVRADQNDAMILLYTDFGYPVTFICPSLIVFGGSHGIPDHIFGNFNHLSLESLLSCYGSQELNPLTTN